MDYKVHKTAIIDKGAKIGTGSRIWQWVHVSAGAQIGSDVSLGQNVFVGNKSPLNLTLTVLPVKAEISYTRFLKSDIKSLDRPFNFSLS